MRASLGRVLVMALAVSVPYAALAQCGEVFGADSLVVDAEAFPIPVCLPVDYAEAWGATFTVDGDAVAGPLEGCAPSVTYFYTFSTARGASERFEVTEWDRDGEVLAGGEFEGGEGLATALLALDSTGAWRYDEGAKLVSGGREGAKYGRLRITRLGDTETRELLPSSRTGFNSVALAIERPGRHLVAIATADGCRDTVTAVVAGGGDAQTAPLRVDSVHVEVFGDEPFLACALPPFSSPVGEARVCGTSGPFVAVPDLDGRCLRVAPQQAGAAEGEVCLRVCPTDPAAACKTTRFLVTQLPACDGGLARDSLLFTAGDDRVAICLAEGRDLSSFRLSTEGDLTLAAGTEETCGETVGGGGGEQLNFYSTADLTDGGVGRPIELRLWSLGIEGLMNLSFAGIEELADELSDADPQATWTYDASLRGILGSTLGGRAGTLSITDVGTGTSFDIPRDTITLGGGNAVFVPGTVLSVGRSGWSTLRLLSADSTCGDRLTVFREFAGATSADTVRVTTPQDVAVSPPCVGTDEIGDAPVTIRLAGGSPTRGEVEFASYTCARYTPPAGFVGVDTVSVVVCGQRGRRCDTTTYLIDVTAVADCDTPAWTIAEVEAEAPTCDDAAALCIPAVAGDRPGLALTLDGEAFVPGPACDTSLASYSLALAPGTYQLRATWAGSACAQVLTLRVTCPTPEEEIGLFRRDTISVATGERFVYCPEFAELPGGADIVTNDCPSIDTVADFSLLDGCLSVSPFAVGSVEACLIGCNGPGRCDTLLLTVFAVAPRDTTPGSVVDAVDDMLRVSAGAEVTAALLANDIVTDGGPAVVTLVADGDGADVRLGSDGRLTYRAPAETCDFTEVLAYSLCVSQVCDTAAVLIRVSCGDFPPMIGFSPNGDGRNETFVLDGLEAYPGAKLSVFNRWGNVVLEVVDYDNSWTGKWSGKNLPDGVYYYVAELPTGEPQTGTVVIQR